MVSVIGVVVTHYLRQCVCICASRRNALTRLCVRCCVSGWQSKWSTALGEANKSGLIPLTAPTLYTGFVGTVVSQVSAQLHVSAHPPFFDDRMVRVYMRYTYK